MYKEVLLKSLINKSFFYKWLQTNSFRGKLNSLTYKCDSRASRLYVDVNPHGLLSTYGLNSEMKNLNILQRQKLKGLTL